MKQRVYSLSRIFRFPVRSNSRRMDLIRLDLDLLKRQEQSFEWAALVVLQAFKRRHDLRRIGVRFLDSPPAPALE